MANRLHPAYDPQNDVLLHKDGGQAEIVWFVDFTDEHTRRVRDILLRSWGRFGNKLGAVAVRIVPQDQDSESAMLAAKAAVAAHFQGHYPEMHAALFEYDGDFERATVIEIARSIGIDVGQFEKDLESNRTAKVLDNAKASFQSSTAGRLPTFFIDERAYEGGWDETSVLEAIQKPLGLRIRLASTDFFQWAASAGVVLVLSTFAALSFVNFGGQHLYHHLQELKLGLSIGEYSFSLPLEAWVNDGLMALFFLLVGIEIKREIVDGELSSFDKAILPILGAIGGMVVPAALYLVMNYGTPSAHGWGVPMATDIAFTLGLMAILGKRVPVSLKIFVSALAIADDLGAIIVIALFYSKAFSLDAFIAAGAVLCLMAVLNWARVYSRVPYLLLFILLWFFTHESGLHATLAGVLTAACIPSRSSAELQSVVVHAQQIIDDDLTNQNETISDSAFHRLQSAIDRLREPGFHLQTALEHWVNFLVLPLFAFFNTGILLTASSASLAAPEALGVILGLVVGKPLGIVLAVYLAVQFRIARLSSEINWGQMIGAGILAGIGFTMSIFIASAAFEGSLLATVKISILVASAAAAITGMLCLYASARKTDGGRY